MKNSNTVQPLRHVKMSIGQKMWQARYLYLMLLPFLVWLILFNYVPMGGIVLAFKSYKAKLGILGSPWVGLDNFRRIFATPQAISAIKNTLWISLNRIIWEFPVPILLAILITEMPGTRLKKVYQTVYTFPHFLSWIVIASVFNSIFAEGGAINMLLKNMGMEKISFLSNVKLFEIILYATSDWKEMGWGAIIYMAAITGIDPTLYEAASIDGAGRIRRIIHVTLPGIVSTIIIMFILKIGGMMNAGFDQLFNMRNSIIQNQLQILDTYIYDITFGGVPNYGFSTAVGLFKSVINFALLVLTNQLTGIVTGMKMFSFRKSKAA